VWISRRLTAIRFILLTIARLVSIFAFQLSNFGTHDKGVDQLSLRYDLD